MGVVNGVVMTIQIGRILPKKYMSLNGKVNALVSPGHHVRH